MIRWLMYLGLTAALVGSVYLGRIATDQKLVESPNWSTMGYSLISD